MYLILLMFGMVAGVAFSTGEETTDTEEQPGDTDTPTDTGSGDDMLALMDETEVSTGAGDDTITMGEDYTGDLTTLSAGSGDDSITLSADNATINGNDGNDAITVDGTGTTVNGGAGNDTIDGGAILGGEVYGDSGDDQLILTYPAGIDTAPYASGGAGNDTLDLSVTPSDAPDTEVPVVAGGSGDDIFNLTVAPPVLTSETAVDGETFQALLIEDFDPEADTLSIDTSAIDQEFTFSGVEIASTDTYTDVLVNFANTEGVIQTSVIRLDGVTELSLDDIQLEDEPEEPGPVAEPMGTSGDDSLTFEAFANDTLEAGAGNDTISVADISDAVIRGEEGDDRITLPDDIANGVTLEGGADDDILSAGGNVTVSGGAGDDVLNVTGAKSGDAELSADGGSGDDAINFTGEGLTNPGTDLPATITGSEGNDIFTLSLTQGTAAEGVTIARTDPESGTAQVESVVIGDFTQGEDLIVIDAGSSTDGEAATSAWLQSRSVTVEGEDEPQQITELALRYTDAEDEAVRDVIVNLGTGPVSWDDISFTGDATPEILENRAV